MSNQPLVSVICLSMNHEAFIERSFQSVVKQTYLNLEIFYVDNHSADVTFEKGCDILERSGRPFKAVRRQALYGISENINFFLPQATGKYVTIISADDWWDLDNLTRKVAYFELNPQYGMLHGAGFLYYHDTGKIVVEDVPSKKTGWIFKEVVKRNFINTIGVIIKKEVLDDVGYFDEASALEDWDMWIRIAEKYQVGFFETPLVYYGRHGANASNKKVFMEAGYAYIFSKYRHLKEIKAAQDHYKMVEVYTLAAAEPRLQGIFRLLTTFRFTTVHFKQLAKAILGVSRFKKEITENHSNESEQDTFQVLWLPAWYPSRVDFLPGDFTDRHAKATSVFANITVLFVSKDKTIKYGQTHIEKCVDGNLTILRAYYNCPDQYGYASKLWSVTRHMFLLWKLYRKAKKEQGAFNLAHVHISLRQGLLAQWLRWRTGLPFVITEQNSWFMPLGDRYFTTSFLLQKIIQANFKKADAIHTVSASLGEQLKRRYPFIRSYTVIPNVVDTNLFYATQRATANQLLSFFTITGNSYHKNSDGILRAFSKFIKAGHSALMHVAGPNSNKLSHLANELDIGDHVVFHGALSYPTIASMMQQADAQIFFTRYETFGCVMAEALCCGKPVIASKIPVLEENLQHLKNALFVQPENEDDLAHKLALFINTKDEFDTLAIAEEAAAKYNYAKIGRAFVDLYLTVPGKISR